MGRDDVELPRIERVSSAPIFSSFTLFYLLSNRFGCLLLFHGLSVKSFDREGAYRTCVVAVYVLLCSTWRQRVRPASAGGLCKRRSNARVVAPRCLTPSILL